MKFQLWEGIRRPLTETSNGSGSNLGPVGSVTSFVTRNEGRGSPWVRILDHLPSRVFPSNNLGQHRKECRTRNKPGNGGWLLVDLRESQACFHRFECNRQTCSAPAPHAASAAGVRCPLSHLMEVRAERKGLSATDLISAFRRFISGMSLGHDQKSASSEARRKRRSSILFLMMGDPYREVNCV